MIDIRNFKKHLATTNFSEKTQAAYLAGITNFAKFFKNADKNSLLLYRAKLISLYKPTTVNLRIRAINYYVTWIGHPENALKTVKIQRKTVLDNVISQSDFVYLCNCLRKDQNEEMYFLVRFLGCTGARISEVLKFNAESVRAGYIDLYAKGNKIRRIYIPKILQKECLAWKSEGLLWNLTEDKVRVRMRYFSKKYKINPRVLHPHSFRHRFALNWIAKNKDLALLADILGHESIETTRIYLTRTNDEMMTLVNRYVTW